MPKSPRLNWLLPPEDQLALMIELCVWPATRKSTQIGEQWTTHFMKILNGADCA